MYPVGDLALQLIRGDDRSFEWAGTIKLANGTVVPYDMTNIVQGTGNIRTSCSAPGLGQTASSELSIQMYLDVDIETLKNAVMNVSCRVYSDSSSSAIQVESWGDVSQYEWMDINGVEWGDEVKNISLEVPIGEFTIAQAKRTMDSVRIIAYDNMQKFDTQIVETDSYARSPVDWLETICRQCKVGLGSSQSEIMNLPNGTRMLTFADVDSSIKTYRQLLSKIAEVLCAVAKMNRNGELELVPCTSDPIRIFTPSDRFSSEFEDYTTYYTGLYLQYKAGGIQEYYSTSSTEDDVGSIIDLGANPFLQISNDSTRMTACTDIIGMYNGFSFVPFDIEVPYDPTIDLMDVIAFTGNHAPTNAIAPITEISATVNGTLTLRCSVEKTGSDLLRDDKWIDGTSGEGSSGMTYGSSGFWLQIDSGPDEDMQFSGAYQTTLIEIKTSIAKTRTQITWTGDYVIDADCTVTVEVFFNSTIIYSTSDEQKAGQHSFSVTTGYEVESEGNCEFSVRLRVPSGVMVNILKDMARMTVLGIGISGMSVDSGESLTIDGELAKDIADTAELDYPDDTDFDEIAKELGLGDADTLVDDNGNKLVDKDTYDKTVEKLKEKWPTKPDASPDPKVTEVDGRDYVNLGEKDTSGGPYKIVITTNPDKMLYNSGESIDTTGMVVTAYTASGSVWTNSDYPDGIVPLSEITLSPTTIP